MQPIDHAIDIITTHIVGLIACDEDARKDFEYHVGEYLDWYSYADKDKEEIYRILKDWVGDFTEPNRY